MIRLRVLLGRARGVIGSLLLHGGLAALACLSLVRIQGGSRGGGEGGQGNGLPPLAGLKAGLHQEPERLNAECLPDETRFGPVTDLDPVPVDLSRPSIPFDAFPVEVREESLPVADAGLPPDPQTGRFSAELRGARLPSAPSAPGEAGGTGALAGPVGTGLGSGSGQGTGDGAGDATDAVLVYAPDHYEYPREARRQSIEGEVVVEITIRVDGTCAVNRILQSSGSRIFDEAIYKMVSSWKYKPATQGGRPVPTIDRVRFRFQLTK